MKQETPGYETKSVEMLAFEIYCRTGRRIPHGAIQAELERKFNIWHDPSNGQFTFAQGGIAGPSSREARNRYNPVLEGELHRSAKPKAPAKAPELPKDWREGGAKHIEEIEQRADHAMPQFYDNIARGMAVEDAAAWAANSEVESMGNPSLHQDGGGPGRGYFQLGANVAKLDRRIKFKEIMGISIEKATLDQQWQFAKWELANTEKPAKAKIDAAKGAGAKAYAISLHFLRPGAKVKAAIDRANLAEAIMRRKPAELPKKKPQASDKVHGLHFMIPTAM